MNIGTAAFLTLLALLAGILLLITNACGGGNNPANPPSPPTLAKEIQHVVVIVQENRTPDNLFQDPVLIARGADIAQSGINSSGQLVPLAPIDLANQYDISHAHSAFVSMYDSGKMDGADKIPTFCLPGVTTCTPPNPQFQYVIPEQVQPYFQMAEQYAFADRMFQTNQGPSFPAHLFLISGTSAPTATSPLFVAENANGLYGSFDTGCTAPPGQTVNLIDAAGDESSTMFPCFEHQALTDLLNEQNISWRYYTPSSTYLWAAPNAIQHICQPKTTNGQAVCTGPDWAGPSPKIIVSPTQVLDDIALNQLPQVSWVVPTGLASDHAAGNDGSGPSWVASIVNAIGNSQYWPHTAIIVTWDDWGGWYDHVAPTIINSYEYGFRVPLLVISPYAKRGYISHVTHDFGSILRFIESMFALPSLGFADATADDLSDCFDPAQTPINFVTIPAPFGAYYFLHNPRPFTEPDDD